MESLAFAEPLEPATDESSLLSPSTTETQEATSSSLKSGEDATDTAPYMLQIRARMSPPTEAQSVLRSGRVEVKFTIQGSRSEVHCLGLFFASPLYAYLQQAPNLMHHASPGLGL